MPSSAESLETIGALRRAVQSYTLPPNVRTNVDDEAQLARFDHLRQLASANTLEGLDVAERLVRAGHVAEGEAIIDRAVARWRRWLRQVQTFDRENYERNAGLSRELSQAFDGAIDLIVEQLPSLPPLPTVGMRSGLVVGIGVGLLAWMFSRKGR